MFKSYKLSKLFVVMLSFLSFVIAYIIRTNLSVALVAMVNSPSHIEECPNNLNDSKDLKLDKTFGHLNKSYINENKKFLSWSKPIQGYILASFFYGYIVTQIPGGWLSFKYGAKQVLGVGLLTASIFTLLSPLAAFYSPWTFMIARVAQGLGEGVMLPATHSLIAKWCPAKHKTKMTTYIYSGIPLGTIAAMPLSGYLSKYGFAGGWPSVFYVSGVMGVLWYLAWTFLVYESPFSNPHIDASELAYLQSEFFPHGAPNTINKQGWKDIPLSNILKSAPFWAIVFGNVAHTWGLYTLITEIPTYYKEALNMHNIYKNGLFSAIPFLAMWICLLSGGQISDYFRARGVKTGRMRKIFNSIGLLVPASIFIFIAYAIKDVCLNRDSKWASVDLGKQNSILAITSITLIAGFLGFGNSGYMVNPLDLSPNLAGILLSISNTFGTLSGIISPSMTSAFTSKNSGPKEWRKVFLFASFILTFGAIFFLCAASGNEQSWSPTKKIYVLASNDENNEKLNFTESNPDQQTAVSNVSESDAKEKAYLAENL